MSVTDGGNNTGGDDNGNEPIPPAQPAAQPAAEAAEQSTAPGADQPKPGYKKKSVWLRGLFMVLFMIFFEIGEWLLGIVAVLQFLWLLFDKAPNENIKRFGQSLSAWLQQVGRYQSCDTDEKPFPWAQWPKAE